MKKGITYVANEKFIAIASKMGASFEDKKGWTKIFFCAAHRVYVPKTKNVGRVDISGFELKDLGTAVVDLGGESFGNVHQQLNTALTEIEVLANFETVLSRMKALPQSNEVPRKQGAVKAEKKSNAKPAEPEEPKSPAEQRKLAILAKAQDLIASGLSPMEAISQARAEIEKQVSA